jgi:protein ImuB
MNRARPLREPVDQPGLRLVLPPSLSARSTVLDDHGCHWLALHLPALSLQVFERTVQTPLPLAVSERARILTCNQAAQALGIHPGIGDGAARALAERLRIVPRCQAAERGALEQLAAWALGVTDLVSLDLEAERPAAMVLEVRRSLRLFGGAEALYRRVTEEVRALGWRVDAVLAPTPAAAFLLARAGIKGLVTSQAAVRRALADLPPVLLVQDRQALDDLNSMGVRSLGALLRLPRAGLAERFGLSLLHRIEQLLGERADPRRPFEPPARFHAELELPAEVGSTDGLQFACRRLLDDLASFLAARQGGVQRLDWSLRHADLAPTRFVLGTATPERDPERLLGLLRERLGRLRLPRPVRAIMLSAERIEPLPPGAGELFPTESGCAVSPASLLDRLRARLGDRAVRGLALAADHRPERAWRWVQPGVDEPATGRRNPAADRDAMLLARAERPLWLFPEPLLLEQRERLPWLDGPLKLGPGCERIETGWWDDFEVARDYYIAKNRRGERLWIYREMRGERRWFLHGLMGLQRP